MAHLHNLASYFWNKPETANCTIVIPLPSPSRRSPVPPPRLTLKLHKQYLSAKSLFLRGLFTGASPIDLFQSLGASRPQPPLRVPKSRLPRLLPSPPSHPILFLPVPDPSSIQPLIHWMYFGNTDHIENALCHGDIHWEGLARNVEYLALSTDIKVFLGRWYRSWYLPARCPSDCSSPCPTDEDDASDLSDSDDSDDDEYDSPASLFSESDDDDEGGCEDVCDRGRTRNIKPLIQLCGKLRMSTT
ncbi:hypothetical protein J3R82DRAFT_7681 [Butyriboletus roseoflavus]|nr:hypothetical protein J3R82DRAFT_7681 [Butyriboletus roseoflavus]